MKNSGVAFVLVASIVLAGVVFLAAAQAPSGASQSATASKPPASAQTVGPKLAEEQFKNIQVLKGIPADQLIPAMQFIANSLHVDCEYCHVERAFEKDDKPEKKTARQMIQMMQTINKNNFDGHREVTCATCHNGRPHPMSVPAIADEHTPPPLEKAEHHEPNSAPEGPSPESIIDQYVRALGGRTAIENVATRVQKGTMTMNGKPVAIEIYSQAPDKRVSVAHMPDAESITAFNGTEGWLVFGNRPPRPMNGADLDAAHLDADLHFATDIKTLFPKFRTGRPEKIGDQEMNVLMALREGQPPVRLYFDKQTGLLARMIRYSESPLGRNPTQIDYSDYRDLGGVKTPYTWTLSRPSGLFTIRVTNAQVNVPIDASRFEKPTTPATPAH